MFYRGFVYGLSSYKYKKNIERVVFDNEDWSSSEIFKHSFNVNLLQEIEKLFSNINFYFFNYINSQTKKIGVIIEEIEKILGDHSQLKNLIIKGE